MHTRLLVVAFLALACTDEAGAAQAAPLVVLSETGRERDGLPVLTEHDSSSAIAASLSRGFGGVALRLFEMEQRYRSAREGTAVEPAYLLLSKNQGGFPRFGFYLDDERKAEVAYVDLHTNKPLSGRFGASDQIFPHELAHVLLMQMAGAPTSGGSNQVHALNVRTDPLYAFNEGFAEHVQVLAVDHPDAAPDTRALLSQPRPLNQVQENLHDYRRERLARWAPLGRTRMTFPLWYSGAEQVLRYHGVKANAFSRQPHIPEALLETSDPYDAYLLENILPGEAEDPPKSRRRMESTEGVVAALFVRWSAHEGLRQTWREDAFYAPFGVAPSDVTPQENVYLKLLHVLYEAKPDRVAALIEAYADIFPDEGPFVEDVVQEAFLGQGPVDAPELWLANPDFATGTSLFDQLRGLPRTHTFDLNGASITDLVGVPGVDTDLARAVLAGAPYGSVTELQAVEGVTADLLARFRGMEEEMARLTSSSDEREAGLSIGAVLRPFLIRLAVLMALASAVGARLYTVVRARGDEARLPRFRRGLNGFGATALALAGGWALGGVPLASAVVSVGVVFGVPAALLGGLKARSVAAGMWALAAWLAAAVPMGLLVTPMF